MKKIDILKVRINYQELKNHKKNLKSLKKELVELSKTEEVKRYLEIISILESEQEILDQNLIERSFLNIKSEKLDKIYLKEGYYIKNRHNNCDDMYTVYIEAADYVRYFNIVDYHVENIEVSEYKTFENKHHILDIPLYPKQFLQFAVVCLKEYYYELLLNEDFSDQEIVEKLQDKVKELSKNHKEQ